LALKRQTAAPFDQLEIQPGLLLDLINYGIVQQASNHKGAAYRTTEGAGNDRAGSYQKRAFREHHNPPHSFIDRTIF
jgi:hypothetical protein